MAAGVFCCISRHRPASKDLKRECRVLNCPGHGTSFGKKFSKGTFKARNLQSKFFSQFLVFRIGLRKMHAELGVLPRPEGHTVARIRARRKIKSLSFRSGLFARNLLLGFAGSSPVPAPDSRCGNHLEIIWKSCGKRTLTGYPQHGMFVRFRGQSVSHSCEIAWTEFTPLRRSGDSVFDN